MDFLIEDAWILPAVPLGLAVLLWLLGRYTGKLSSWLAMLGPATVLAGGVVAVTRMLGSHSELTPPAPYVGQLLSRDGVLWMSQGDAAIGMGWALDGLSALMLVVVGLVALMVMLFSVGYMSEERDYNRYFTLLSLFTASMTGLVLADNLVGVFLAWELVGVCSYLLIGFWYEKPTASAAAIKAFLVTRVGDVGFLLGLGVLWNASGALGLQDVVMHIPEMSTGTLTAAAALLFMGAAGKSAQFPLHIWLPDAMEGPTPVSALIHAATMVAAGVFLLARVWPLFEAAEAVLNIVMILGVITAFGAATAAIAQRDIKKVLAYSTISQLGFMFVALGVGAWRVAMFHLVTHAAFKALLFLGSGSVIHGAGTQDMYEMGGLRKEMPLTFATWVIGALALAGIYPLAGFFSKDEIIASVLHETPWAAIVLVAASAMTALYITRATRLTFLDTRRGEGHAHESGPAMAVPLVILAAFAAGLGFFGHQIIEILGGEAHGVDIGVATVSLAMAGAGIALGYMLFGRGRESDERMEGMVRPVWGWWREAYAFDALVERTFIGPTVAVAQATYQAVDRFLIDSLLVEGTGGLTKRIGRGLARLQYGDLQWYVSMLAGGVLVLIALGYYLASGGEVRWPWT